MFSPPPDKGKRIAVRLIIEFPTVTIIYKDDAMRASMRFLLEVEGWNVREFKSPTEFLANLGARCLVLEQDLPRMSGLDLVEELGNRGVTLPVVLTTERDDADFLARAKTAGATVVAPLSPTDVIAAISAIIGAPVPCQPQAYQAGRADRSREQQILI